jgi:hypothetical protein
MTFVLVNVSVSSSRRTTEAIGWSAFTLRSAAGESWEPHTGAHLTLSGAGYSTLGAIEQVGPGTAIGGWLVFRVPADAVRSLHVRFEPKREHLDLALPLPKCGESDEQGICMEASLCDGRRLRGLCDGGGNIQCCISEPPKAP